MKYSDINKYVRELGKVLRTFDPSEYRRFLERWSGTMLDPSIVRIFQKKEDWFVLGCMAKMVMERTDMLEESRAKARAILDELGWDYHVFGEDPKA